MTSSLRRRVGEIHVISELADDLRAFLITVRHSRNFVEGRMQLIPYLDLGKIRVLRVALIGSSSQCGVSGQAAEPVPLA